MKDDLKKITAFGIFLDTYYEVPVYQRNYAWGKEQIEQLIDDIYGSRGDYFLGNLIVNEKENNVYEVIDGQQRLTTLYLLERYLEISFEQNSLRFEARERSNRTLRNIGTDTYNLTDEVQSEEIINGFKIIGEYFVKEGLQKEELRKKLERVHLIRVQVPKDIDLNHYFEIMNTRGEQLELHEIAKSKLLEQLTSNQEKKIANDIWEYCSNMNSYVQMNFPKEKRESIFSNDWSNLSVEVTGFDSLKNFYSEASEGERARLTLEEILGKDSRDVKIEKVSKEDEENERFESILSFPNFLLQVNAALTSVSDEKNASLDDKNLLSNLEKNWTDELAVKKFLFTLLKSRVIFDKFVLKREYAHDYKEVGKWSLQKLKKSNSSAMYVATFGGNTNDEDSDKNKKIRALQSALRITYTSPKTMHWVSLVLERYLNNNENDILTVLEEYAQSKVDESDYLSAKGFEFSRIVFSYLDYLVYRDGYKYKNEEIIKPLTDKGQFQFRNSIEHFHPQNPTEQEKWEDKDLDGFGNLALITVTGNSKFSNLNPIGKVGTYPSIMEQSLKLKIMAEMMERNKNIWNQEIAEVHKEEMFQILRKVSTSK